MIALVPVHCFSITSRQGSNQSQLQILGVMGVFVTLRKQLAENAIKSQYHVYKVIVVSHIYNNILSIRLAGYPANKNESLHFIKFREVYLS